jgi:hypothetical protein
LSESDDNATATQFCRGSRMTTEGKSQALTQDFRNQTSRS